MINVGNFNQLRVKKITKTGAFLESSEGDVFLPSKKGPANLSTGDVVNVFVYHRSDNLLAATTVRPKAVVGEFAYLHVKDVTKVGAFLDWGLEKELFVPFKEQSQRMVKGKHYIVRLDLDERTNRVYASSRLSMFLETASSDLEVEQQVNLLIYVKTDLGIKVIINNRYEGMIFFSDVHEELHVGDVRQGFIKNIREDGKIDVSLHRQGYEAINDLKPSVLDVLEKAGGFLPCHDKSSPEEIKSLFKMSKKAFKKSIGALYKEGKISIEDDGIRLLQE